MSASSITDHSPAAAAPAGAGIPAGAELVPGFAELGVRAFTSGRLDGSFGTQSDEPVREVMARWSALRELLGGPECRLATAMQVHGDQIVQHADGWRGWLRGGAADGHLSASRGTAMAVTVADCVPVFLAHPAGASAVLHSGWRGTAARIVTRALAAFTALGYDPADIRVHCGPAICGRCYEVSPDVHAQLTGARPSAPTVVDLRAIISGHAREAGVRHITTSPSCTRCDNDRFFSHRAGDAGRQLGVLFAE